MFSRATMLFAGFVALASPVPAVEPETFWTQACARCHRDVAALAAPYAAMDEAMATDELDGFLARHRAADPETRTALIAWLLAQAGLPASE